VKNKIKLLTVIGARPQIIKAAGLSRAIQNRYSDQVQEIILHTGQHYDTNMSDIFFEELGIPLPDINLNVGSYSHGKQTGFMIEGIEKVLLDTHFDGVVLYGDTNSTLAGAIAASKIGVPVFHIEAGLRSFNKTMPEEINRIHTDHVSTLLFCPTEQAIKNLVREGFKLNNDPPYHISNPKVIHSGDIMFDNTLYFGEIAEKKYHTIAGLPVKEMDFVLCTVHRNQNTDNYDKLTAILKALLNIVEQTPVVFPVHPRTAKKIEELLSTEWKIKLKQTNLHLVPPVSFLEMNLLEKYCSLVITDSGGVQKESYFWKKSCIVLRPETEWVELVENGYAYLADTDTEKIISLFNILKNDVKKEYKPLYGNGNAGEFILSEITTLF
jgi:UDP-GlcNAc3NAcA epimerase